MTHDILQSDIDLVRKLIATGRPANEIVDALHYRGIDSNRAARLITDLQSGKAVEPDKPIKINLASTATPLSSRPEPQRSLSRESPPKRAQHSRSHSRAEPPSHWFTIIGLAAVLVCIVAFVFLNRRSHRTAPIGRDQPQAASKSSIAPLAADQSATPPRLDPKLIAVEVKRNGLELCGSPLARESFSASIFKILGSPSRTNQVEKMDRIIYAYDAFGLLVYLPKNSGDYSIVLDFEASDGAAGTKNAFMGKLKVNENFVHAGTDAASLALIKELAVETPGSASGIFRAQYGALELVFGYLKSPERLSLVEIDLK